MAIDPSIPLQGILPKFDTPADALEKRVRIQDMLAQLHQRNAETADYNAQAPLRQADLANKLQTAAENSAIKQTFAQSMKPYDPNVGDIEFDQDKWDSLLSQHQIPGIGSGNYLRSKMQAQLDQQTTAHRQQAISEAAEIAKANLPIATAGENLLTANHTREIDHALTGDDNAKIDAAYPEFRAIATRINPANGKLLPPALNDDNRANVLKIVHGFVSQHKLTEDTAEQLKSAQNEETLSLSTQAGRDKALNDQIASYTASVGHPPDQAHLDQMLQGINERAGYKGFKAVAPGTYTKPLQKISDVNGSALKDDANAIDETGQAIPPEKRTEDTQFHVMRHADGTIRYVEYQPTDKEKADIQYKKAGSMLRQHQADLADARAEMEKFKNDPDSPQYKAAARRADIAQENVDLRKEELGLKRDTAQNSLDLKKNWTVEGQRKVTDTIWKEINTQVADPNVRLKPDSPEAKAIWDRMRASANEQGAHIGEYPGTKGYKPNPSPNPVKAPATDVPIVQHSKSTGQYRYSTDGGKTWKPGKPPGQ